MQTVSQPYLRTHPSTWTGSTHTQTLWMTLGIESDHVWPNRNTGSCISVHSDPQPQLYCCLLASLKPIVLICSTLFLVQVSKPRNRTLHLKNTLKGHHCCFVHWLITSVSLDSWDFTYNFRLKHFFWKQACFWSWAWVYHVGILCLSQGDTSYTITTRFPWGPDIPSVHHYHYKPRLTARNVVFLATIQISTMICALKPHTWGVLESQKRMLYIFWYYFYFPNTP